MSDHQFQGQTVKARKAHTCFGCLVEIKAGDKYVLQSHVEHGDWWRIKLCAVCEKLTRDPEVMGLACDVTGSFGEGDLAEWAAREDVP